MSREGRTTHPPHPEEPGPRQSPLKPSTGARGPLRLLTIVVAVALAGCGSSSGSDDACGPVERPRVQGGGHLLGDREPPVPYSSTPPTSGWHASGAPLLGRAGADDPLSEPEQVSVLEAGGIVISYRDISADDLSALQSVEREFPDQIALTPYANLQPGQVALTAWGILQRCDRVDPGVVRSFIETYAHEAGTGEPHTHTVNPGWVGNG
ncbi:MAG: DUF3105 domain-containing protein [Egibacteraceae bacterium]